ALSTAASSADEVAPFIFSMTHSRARSAREFARSFALVTDQLAIGRSRYGKMAIPKLVPHPAKDDERTRHRPGSCRPCAASDTVSWSDGTAPGYGKAPKPCGLLRGFQPIFLGENPRRIVCSRR